MRKNKSQVFCSSCFNGEDHPCLTHRQIPCKPVMDHVQDIPPVGRYNAGKRVKTSRDVFHRDLKDTYSAAGDEALMDYLVYEGKVYIATAHHKHRAFPCKSFPGFHK